jgi:hypothetical protein
MRLDLSAGGYPEVLITCCTAFEIDSLAEIQDEAPLTSRSWSALPT